MIYKYNLILFITIMSSLCAEGSTASYNHNPSTYHLVTLAWRVALVVAIQTFWGLAQPLLKVSTGIWTQLTSEF